MKRSLHGLGQAATTRRIEEGHSKGLYERHGLVGLDDQGTRSVRSLQGTRQIAHPGVSRRAIDPSPVTRRMPGRHIVQEYRQTRGGRPVLDHLERIQHAGQEIRCSVASGMHGRHDLDGLRDQELECGDIPVMRRPSNEVPTRQGTRRGFHEPDRIQCASIGAQLGQQGGGGSKPLILAQPVQGGLSEAMRRLRHELDDLPRDGCRLVGTTLSAEAPGRREKLIGILRIRRGRDGPCQLHLPVMCQPIGHPLEQGTDTAGGRGLPDERDRRLDTLAAGEGCGGDLHRDRGGIGESRIINRDGPGDIAGVPSQRPATTVRTIARAERRRDGRQQGGLRPAVRHASDDLQRGLMRAGVKQGASNRSQRMNPRDVECRGRDLVAGTDQPDRVNAPEGAGDIASLGAAHSQASDERGSQSRSAIDLEEQLRIPDPAEPRQHLDDPPAIEATRGVARGLEKPTGLQRRLSRSRGMTCLQKRLGEPDELPSLERASVASDHGCRQGIGNRVEISQGPRRSSRSN